MKAAGPIGSVVEAENGRIKASAGYRSGRYEFAAGASALILMNRVAFFDERASKLDDEGQRALLRWAVERALGQNGKLLGQVAARRDAALTELRRRGLSVARFAAEPEWRLAVGLGNKANPHEIGLSLHGTYGCPVIPGTSLKGLAAAWAVASGADHDDIRRVLGTPRRDLPAPASELKDPDSGNNARLPQAARGTVCFLDAIPLRGRVDVQLDVLTPHVKPYYSAVAGGEAVLVPPAEYHNPVPVNFLTVRGAFAVDLYGAAEADVNLAARWLSEAASELGAGGKTAAGYGYLVMKELPRKGSR